MRRLIVTTVHEMAGDDCVEWVLERLLQGGITREEILALRREGHFTLEDRVPRRGVTLKTTVVLEPFGKVPVSHDVSGERSTN